MVFPVSTPTSRNRCVAFFSTKFTRVPSQQSSSKHCKQMVRLNYAPTQTQAGIVSRTYQYQQQRRQTSRMESSDQDFKHGRNAESVLFSTKSETTDGNFFSPQPRVLHGHCHCKSDFVDCRQNVRWHICQHMEILRKQFGKPSMNIIENQSIYSFGRHHGKCMNM